MGHDHILTRHETLPEVLPADYLGNLVETCQENDCDDQRDNIQRHTPKKLRSDRTHQEPAQCQGIKGHVCVEHDSSDALHLGGDVSGASENLHGDGHSETGCQVLLEEDPVVDLHCQVPDRCNQVFPEALIWKIVIIIRLNV